MVGRKATCLPRGPGARRLDRRVGQVRSPSSSQRARSSRSRWLSSSNGTSVNASSSLANRSGAPASLSESSDEDTAGGQRRPRQALPLGRFSCRPGHRDEHILACRALSLNLSGAWVDREAGVDEHGLKDGVEHRQLRSLTYQGNPCCPVQSGHRVGRGDVQGAGEVLDARQPDRDAVLPQPDGERSRECRPVDSTQQHHRGLPLIGQRPTPPPPRSPRGQVVLERGA